MTRGWHQRKHSRTLGSRSFKAGRGKSFGRFNPYSKVQSKSSWKPHVAIISRKQMGSNRGKILGVATYFTDVYLDGEKRGSVYHADTNRYQAMWKHGGYKAKYFKKRSSAIDYIVKTESRYIPLSKGLHLMGY